MNLIYVLLLYINCYKFKILYIKLCFVKKMILILIFLIIIFDYYSSRNNRKLDDKNICNKKNKNNLKIIDVIYFICLLVYKVLKEGGMGYKFFFIFKMRILFLYYF